MIAQGKCWKGKIWRIKDKSKLGIKTREDSKADHKEINIQATVRISKD